MAKVLFKDRVRSKHALMFDPKDPKNVSKTQQSFAKDVNINNVIVRYKKTGQLPRGPKRKPMFFGDFTQITDLQSAMDKVKSVEKAFNTLSAPVRARFGHRPTELLAFIQNPANLQECYDLGLLKKPAPVAPPPASPAAAPENPAAPAVPEA